MKTKLGILALVGLGLVNTAQAEINFNGFANLVAGTTGSKSDQLYGFDDNIDFKNGSLIALQASSDLGNGLGVTAQIISRGNEDWDPTFEWAYISYDATDNLRFLVGRQRVPFYMYSDFLDVSYAYPWITPPEGVYSVVFDTFDGVGAIYNTSLGEFDTTIHAMYGSNDDDFNLLGNDVSPDFNDLVGIAITVNREWLTLRGGYVQTEMNIPVDSLNPLITGWEAAGFQEVADNLKVEDDTGSFIELGAQIDIGNFIAVAEFTQLDLEGTSLGDQDSFYVMGGYRLDSVLFHLTYGYDEAERHNFVADVPTGVAPALDFLILQTSALIASQKEETNYYTLGLRWDFHDSAAFKLEYTDYTDDLNSNGDASLIRTAIVTVF